MFCLSYNTNGLRSQGTEMAVKQISAIGYEGVEISLQDEHMKNHVLSENKITGLRSLFLRYNIKPVCLATGDKWLLSDVPHEPSLISTDKNEREKRINLLKSAVEAAVKTDIPVVNFASGFKPENLSEADAQKFLKTGINEVLNHIKGNVILAIEPEPGMYIETCDRARDVIEAVNRHNFRLNMDIGHIECCERDLFKSVKENMDITAHIHIEDIKNKIHKHEIPGEGDIDLKKVLSIIKESGYEGAVSVELYDHDSVCTIALSQSFKYITEIIKEL